MYREDANRETMFTAPEHVFKDGVCVARAGRITALPVGGTHFVEPAYDETIEKVLRRHAKARGTLNFDHVAIGRDELCRCCNGGRLLPTACFGVSP
jgi:formylmethanofuran dehydrogenase subunit A